MIAAVKEAAPGLFLNARTATFWLGGPDLDETLRRARAFAAAGADGIFVPGIAADADIRAVLDAADLPLNVLHLPGRTGYGRLVRLGVHRVSTGSLLFRTALRAAVAAALEVTGAGGAPPVPSYGEVQRLVSGR